MGSRALWLIIKQGLGGLEVLTTSDHVLPVFSFREEAETFLHRKGAGDGWQARETTLESSSLYSMVCRDVKHISLVPLPKILELRSYSRKAFVEALLANDVSFVAEGSEMLEVAS